MYARRLSSAVAGLVVAVSSLVAFAADGPVLLSWKFKTGEQRHYVSEQKTSNETKFQGQTSKSELARTLDMQWAVDSVGADGGAQMTLTITRVRLKGGSPGATPIFEYDSSLKEAPPAAEPVAAGFKPLVGKPIKLKMSPRGTISEITLPKGMADELKKTPAYAASMLGFGESIMNEEWFKQLASDSTLEFADHPVKKGDTWKRTATTPILDTDVKKMTDLIYTFQGTAKDDGQQIDKIGMTMKTSMAPDGEGTPQIEITDQQSEGTIDFDHVAGHIIESRAKVKMVMTITVRNDKVVQTITNDVIMRLANGADDKQASELAK